MGYREEYLRRAEPEVEKPKQKTKKKAPSKKKAKP